MINVHAAAAKRASHKDSIQYQNLLNELQVDKHVLESFAQYFVDTIAISIGGFTLSQRKALLKTIVISLAIYLLDHPESNSNEGFQVWATSSTCDTVVEEAFTQFMITDSSKPKQSQQQSPAQRQSSSAAKKLSNMDENTVTGNEENNAYPMIRKQQERLRSSKDRRNRCLAFRSFQQQK